MRAVTRQMHDFTCFLGWFKRERICSEGSEICCEVFEGYVIMHLVSRNIVVESRIIVVLIIRAMFCSFFLGLELGLGFFYVRTFEI